MCGRCVAFGHLPGSPTGAQNYCGGFAQNSASVTSSWSRRMCAHSPAPYVVALTGCAMRVRRIHPSGRPSS